MLVVYTSHILTLSHDESSCSETSKVKQVCCTEGLICSAFENAFLLTICFVASMEIVVSFFWIPSNTVSKRGNLTPEGLSQTQSDNETSGQTCADLSSPQAVWLCSWMLKITHVYIFLSKICHYFTLNWLLKTYIDLMADRQFYTLCDPHFLPYLPYFTISATAYFFFTLA